jgi:hypothetical protein
VVGNLYIPMGIGYSMIEKDDNNEKGGNCEMIKEQVVITKYRNSCPVCKQLQGQANTEEQANYNLILHLDKHLRNKEITQKQFNEMVAVECVI